MAGNDFSTNVQNLTTGQTAALHTVAVAFAVAAAPAIPGLPTFSVAEGLSANSGGVQTGATPITAAINRFTTVGGAGYSSLLPPSLPGSEITVINADAANAMNVFPQGTDTINALTAGSAFSLAHNKTATFYCTLAGAWHSVLSA